MEADREKVLARERALVILQVHSGALTAKEGAERLGVSRKTYYEWEQRALSAMALVLENRPPGRLPAPVDEEKESLRREVRKLKNKLFLAEKTMEAKQLLWVSAGFKVVGAKKNRTAGRKIGKRR